MKDRYKNTSKKKSEQLGMHFSTASHRLKKIIMFDLVQKAEMGSCFKCKKPIEAVEELSVEHIEPWMDIDPELFWDINNIAFSHIKCNRPHRSNPANKIQNPDGMCWCSNCKTFVPKENFGKNSSQYNGRNSFCKPCAETKRKERRQRRREQGLKVH